jgi:hypothetical protein
LYIFRHVYFRDSSISQTPSYPSVHVRSDPISPLFCLVRSDLISYPKRGPPSNVVAIRCTFRGSALGDTTLLHQPGEGDRTGGRIARYVRTICRFAAHDKRAKVKRATGSYLCPTLSKTKHTSTTQTTCPGPNPKQLYSGARVLFLKTPFIAHALSPKQSHVKFRRTNTHSTYTSRTRVYSFFRRICISDERVRPSQRVTEDACHIWSAEYRRLGLDLHGTHQRECKEKSIRLVMEYAAPTALIFDKVL